MDNMTFGKYIPGNSLIHRLDPRLKICTVLIFLIAVFFDVGFIGYGILAIYVLVCILLSKIKVSHILKAVKPMVFMMLFLMIFNIFLLKTGDVLVKIGSISIYSGALLQTAYIFIRLVLIITLTTLMTSTTKPLELTLAIENLLNPLKRFHFPVHELAMMISIALRFIPDLLDEAKLIEHLEKKPFALEVVLSGRNPSERLIDHADYVSEIRKVKHPFDQGISSRIGIEM